MNKKKSKLTSEERELFRDSVKISHPIQQDKKQIKIRKPRKKSTPIDSPQNLDTYCGSSAALLEKLSPDDSLTAEDYIHFARTGIPYRTLNKLKRGHLPIDARIDLHRLTGDAMIERMSLFLNHCREQGQHSLLVVHGKGGSNPNKPPILKNTLNLWLREQSEVLAFNTAKPHDGGSGALYVLLKSRK